MTETWIARDVDTPTRTDEPIIYKQSPCLSCEHYKTKGWSADKCQETNWRTCPLKPNPPYQPRPRFYMRDSTKFNPSQSIDPRLPEAKLCVVCMRWFHRPEMKARTTFARQISCCIKCGSIYTQWFTDEGLQRTFDRARQIRRLWAGGMQQKDIAKDLGLSKFLVSWTINRGTRS